VLFVEVWSFFLLENATDMVLDIEIFRADKGGDPEKVRDSQRKRYKDPALVDRVVDADNKWRKREFIC
jgi:seryl-tRNA synthetase